MERVNKAFICVVIALVCAAVLVAAALFLPPFSGVEQQGAAASAVAVETIPEGTHSAHDWTHAEGTALDAYDDFLQSGNYYLSGDLALRGGLEIRGDVTLCLNGYALSREGDGSVITVASGGHLTICDCGEHKSLHIYAKNSDSVVFIYEPASEEDALSGKRNYVRFDCGMITGGNVSGVRVNGGGKLTMLSGAIAGNGGIGIENGGGVYIAGGAEAEFNGGVIVGNRAKCGGGICAASSSELALGGNVLIQGNSADMSGGGVIAGWEGNPVYHDESEIGQGVFNLSGNARIIENCGRVLQSYSSNGDYWSLIRNAGENLILAASGEITGGEISGGSIALAKLPYDVVARIRGGKFDAEFYSFNAIYKGNYTRSCVLLSGGYFSQQAYDSMHRNDNNIWIDGDCSMAQFDEYNAEQKQLIDEEYAYGILPRSGVINGQYYAGGALGAEGGALEGGRYFMDGDITAGTKYTIGEGSTVLINLNGHNLSAAAATDAVIEVDGGELILTNTASGGRMRAGAAESAVTVKQGSFVLQSGSVAIENTPTGICAVKIGGGSFVMQGGEILQYAGVAGHAVVVNGGSVRIDGGSISTSGTAAVMSVSGGEVLVNGGSIGGAIVSGGGALNISGGTVGDITVSAGALDISGGTVGDITVSGGEAAVTAGYIGGAQVSGGTLDVTGGYFAVDPSVSPSVAEGYTVRKISADFDKNFKDGYPYGVYAEENIHEERLAVPVTADTAELDGSGISSFYYLAEDVALSGSLRVTGSVELCLNGHTLRGGGSVIVVESGASLTLCDCVGGGLVTGGDAELEGGGVRVLGGTLVMKSGKIANNSAALGGEGIYVRGGVLEISGGTVEGDVLAEDSDVTVTGGYFSEDVGEYAASGYVCVPTADISAEEEQKGEYGIYLNGVTDGYFAISVNGMHEYTGEPVEVSVNGSIPGAPVDVVTVSAYGDATPILHFYADAECTLPLEADEVKDAGVYYMIASLKAYYDTDTRTYYPAESSEAVLVRINQKALTVSDIYALDRYYDGTNEVALYGEAVLSGVVTGEEELVTAVPGIGVMADKNAGENKPVEVSITLEGAGAHNYTLVMPDGVTVNVNPLPLFAEGFSAQDKTYDGTTDITVAEGDVYGVHKGDDVTVTASGVAESANAGSGVGVTITYTLSGADAGNYAAPEAAQSSAAIAKAVPVYSLPEGLGATEGGTLADITLPEGWAWEDASLSVGGAGEKTFTAVFTPSDTANYESVTVQLSVTVASAEPLPNTNPDAALTGGEIAGIAVGSVAGAALIGTGIFFLIRKRRKV